MAPKLILEHFLQSEVLFNITHHKLVPQHILLTPKEKEEMLKQYKVKENQLMGIKTTDPVARYYGYKRGQVIKIVRESKLAGRYIGYRIVI